MAMKLGESELLEPHLDVHALFAHYNALYFDNALGACLVSWSSSRMTSCAGVCRYHKGGGCEIRLSEPLLKFRSTADLKNTLLHEMIHAYLWTVSKNRDHSDHGPTFCGIMNTINCSSVPDFQRPSNGYNITIFHNFHEEVNSYRVHHWMCESCGDLIKRAMNREPSVNDCIEHKGHDKSCGNLLCHWHSHKMQCSGTYTKIAEPDGYKDKRRASSKGLKEAKACKSKGLTCTTRKTAKKSENAGLKDKSKVKMFNTITKFFPSVGGAAASSGNLSSSFNDSPSMMGVTHKQLIIQLKAPEIPKRARTCACRKKRVYGYIQSRKPSKRKRVVTVAIAWLDHFADEESEVDIEPLLNKRSERRKKKKQLLDNFGGNALDTETLDGVGGPQAGSCSSSGVEHANNFPLNGKDSDGQRPVTFLKVKREPCNDPSPSSLPQIHDVVYISD